MRCCCSGFHHIDESDRLSRTTLFECSISLLSSFSFPSNARSSLLSRQNCDCGVEKTAFDGTEDDAQETFISYCSWLLFPILEFTFHVIQFTCHTFRTDKQFFFDRDWSAIGPSSFRYQVISFLLVK